MHLNLREKNNSFVVSINGKKEIYSYLTNFNTNTEDPNYVLIHHDGSVLGTRRNPSSAMNELYEVTSRRVREIFQISLDPQMEDINFSETLKKGRESKLVDIPSHTHLPTRLPFPGDSD